MTVPVSGAMGNVPHMTADIGILYVGERDRLVQDLAALEEDRWRIASLCPGWTVRDLVAHLLMPFELTGGSFLRRMVAARFRFDRMARDWAVRDVRSPAELRTALAGTTAGGFGVPGAGPLAPLSHLTIHAHDVRGPAGIGTPIGADAAPLVLDDITRGKHAVPADRVAGLHLRTTDAPWEFGAGQPVSGPAGAMLSALSGRREAVDLLEGAGVDAFRDRLHPRSSE